MDRNTREGITGEVLQTPVSPSLKDKIDKQLKRYYPGDNTSINVCLYSKGEHAIHNDWLEVDKQQFT